MLICDVCKKENKIVGGLEVNVTYDDGIYKSSRSFHMCTFHAKKYWEACKKTMNFDYEPNGEKEIFE